MVTTAYFGEREEVQAVYVGNRVVNVRIADLFSVWTGKATAWSTLKRF